MSGRVNQRSPTCRPPTRWERRKPWATYKTWKSVNPDVLPDHDDPAREFDVCAGVPKGVEEYGTTAAERRVDEPLRNEWRVKFRTRSTRSRSPPRRRSRESRRSTSRSPRHTRVMPPRSEFPHVTAGCSHHFRGLSDTARIV